MIQGLAEQRLAGQTRQLNAPGDRVCVLSLESSCASGAPPLLSIGLSWGSQGNWTGLTHLVAEIQYGAGEAMAPPHELLEVDVPARGTVITVPGGDGLRVYVRAEVGSAFNRPITVVATVAFSSATAPQPAQRTRRHAIPWVGGLARIPAYARQVRLLSDVHLGLIGNILQYYSDDALGLLLAVQDTSDEKGLAIPAGAEWYQLIGGGAAPPAAQVLSAIWELRL